MSKSPKKVHPEDVMLAAEIGKAHRWSACLHRGPGDRVVEYVETAGAAGYAEARAIGDRLNTTTAFGKRAVVYAITKLGSFPVDSKMAALAGFAS